jgi:hypothetical protein
VYVVFKKKFGVWPNDLFKQKTPIAPSKDFLEWVENTNSEEFPKENKSFFLIAPKTPDSIKKTVPRKGKTSAELAKKFGVTTRTVQRYTSVPREEYLANSLARVKPWEALGMSRSTWYRKGKPKLEVLNEHEL